MDGIALDLCLATRRGARTVYMLDDAREGVFLVVFLPVTVFQFKV